ncbi:zinc finger CCHC domain-containing protein 7-like isoform X1 [Falco naumanni]|uniref:zinc finger CCHC domain-containing protein 7-like isoform X1 n=1 Tax=Falco naumanni TaxID=148594 RepID=UPI001ADE5EFA|nr:zinc finger CCHC domain-containing protein 7-like isoform X1 [Falco naumanni]XP_040434277.1 zinc finger CCHC domain-containing protein 7-like isoform X1 [Falco naumanni]XP_040434278.1 zinc finger CCHC domain-containing protein 7-like isoform X1 [Falco naumanni]
MFGGYEDAEDTEAYEDELYNEESSSEQSVDSEVEFHLYSQIHYSQNLGESSMLEVDEEADVSGAMGHSTVLAEKQYEDKKIAELVDRGAQLSDDPELIVLSDTPDEDSIYKMKAKHSTSSLAQGKTHTHPGSSTPNEAKAARCNTLDPAGSGTNTSRPWKSISGKLSPVSCAGVHDIQDVLVIDDSSEEESLVSESGDVQSWMLLGAGTDDRDKDIMLNLEGCPTSVSEEGVDVDWSICNKDLEAQISNYGSLRHSSMRYYRANKNVTCRNCDRPGHLSKNCPTPKKVPPCCLCAERGHLQNSCPARFCLNCCLPGHFFRECLERAYWNKHCSRCDMKGHYADACPEIWRQYHLTTKPGPIKAASSHPEHSALVYCYNCSQKGHFGYECSERRMHGSMFPTSPFICYYDDEYDIKRRTNRLKRKAAELQEAGLLPEQSETLWQEEKRGGHSHKKSSKPWQEHRKYNKDGECYKKMRMSQAEKPRKEKYRSEVAMDRCLEDFPRGCKRHACKGSKIRYKSIFQAFSGSKTAYVQEPLEGAKRKRKWKKQKDTGLDINENLFLIKQRKKKSKQKSW